MDRSITSAFLSIVGVKFLLISLDFLSSPLLTRFLGEGYGDYALLMSIFAIYMIFVSTGVGDGVRKYVAEERDRPHWDRHVVGFYLRLALLLAAVGCLLLALAARTGFIQNHLGTSYQTYFYLLSLLVFTSQFREYTRRTLMGFGLERYSEPLLFLDKVLFIGVGVGLAYLGYGVPGVLIGHMTGAVTTAVIGLATIHREVSLSTALFDIPSREFPRRELFAFNGLSIVLILFLTSLYQIDVVMLGFIGSTQETGYYRIALTIAEFLWIVPLALQNTLLHSTSNIWANNDRDRINSLAARITRYTLLFTILLAIGLAALAPAALPVIYPADYIASYVPILLLLPGCVGFALARPILAIGQGKGDLRKLIVATGAAAVVNVTLNGLLIPQFGMHGAATATSVSYGLMFVFHLWSARQIGFYPAADARIPRALAVGAAAAVPIFLLTRLLGDAAVPLIVLELPVSLLVVPPFGAVVFLVLSILFGAVDTDEIADLLETAPDPIANLGSNLQQSVRSVSTGAQLLLIVAGIGFLVAGIALAASGAGIGDTITGPDGDEIDGETNPDEPNTEGSGETDDGGNNGTNESDGDGSADTDSGEDSTADSGNGTDDTGNGADDSDGGNGDSSPFGDDSVFDGDGGNDSESGDTDSDNDTASDNGTDSDNETNSDDGDNGTDGDTDTGNDSDSDGGDDDAWYE
ncbi:oligosaccharide flippase family protein [Natronococcus jeotgali]|uniref:Polysaccharide biosynthesis protein n=1 Tax=Natronococcus jeotgali DSM 18795 TaxID=1227498 RepID=L9XW26_9EURY|nr:lipopolysaccharide biosynthesis protein [Natronococcus jeotgali]ELY64828.1 polysaccharide biosynthesis protein [Natronococcus jeotgali DSM 18795]